MMRSDDPLRASPLFGSFPLWRVLTAAALSVLLAATLFAVPHSLFWIGAGAALVAASLAAIYRLRRADGDQAQLGDTAAALPPIDAVPVPLLRFDAAGDLVEANADARAMLGLGPGPLPMTAGLFVDLGRPMREWLRDVGAGRIPCGAEVVALRAEAERFIQISPRAEGSGGTLAVLQDATVIKRLEAQITQGQKMQAIGQLAGGIAHDFNNLLTAITGHCDLLLMRHAPGDCDHADLDQIRQNANRAAALVAQLLAFSRKQTLKPERIDLEETLSDLTHLLDRLLGERVGLELLHARGGLAIRADRRQLEQVIVNLAVNARDAMPDGGVVEIEARRIRLDSPMTRDRAVVPAGEHAVIRVRDSGIGIPPDRLGMIFEPFYTTKRPGEGTGLGLSTAYGIVKQSGGFIFVTSELGVGSCFELWFPVCTEEAVATVPHTQPRRAMKLHGAILLVEDEAPVRAFAARALRMCGHVVLEAGDGEEALAILNDRSLRIDVFVTDVVMPGLDGPDWVMQALATRPGVRTVFISGYAEEALADMQARVPDSVLLPKPFSLRDLTDTVQAQLAA